MRMSSACFGSSNPNIHSASLHSATQMAGAAAIPAVLDALQLDEELEALLYARCEAVCRHAGGKVVNRFEPELRAVLRAALWYLSTVSGEATPAQQLLNMHRVAGAALPRALPQRGLEGRPSLVLRFLARCSREGLPSSRPTRRSMAERCFACRAVAA